MPTSQTSRSRPTLILGAVILIGVVLIGVKIFSSDAVEIHAAGVSRQNLDSRVSTNGKVEPVEYFQAHAPAPGVVGQIYVQVGQKVKAGELLVKMNDAEASARLATATSALRSAEATTHDIQQNGSQEERIALNGDLVRAQMQQKQATIDLEALRKLQQKGAASAAEVASAEQRLASANSTLQGLQQRSTQRYSSGDKARSQAQLADAQAAVKAATINYTNSNIRTPLSGTVYSIPINQYDFVPAGEDLMDVADLNRIQVRAYFDEPDIGKLLKGQAVKIVWEAKPNQVWHGHIELAPTTVITYGTRNVGECLIAVDDARGDLLPNTNVTVTVTTSQRFNVLSIPREALHTDAGDFVYRIVDKKLVKTPVQIGVTNLTRVEITGGLTEKDTVALSATTNRDLAAGLTVKVVD